MPDNPEISGLKNERPVDRFQKRFDALQKKTFDSETDIDRELGNLQDILRDLDADKKTATESAQKIETDVGRKSPADRNASDDQGVIDAWQEVARIEEQMALAQSSVQNLESRRQALHQGSADKLERMGKRIEQRAERGTEQEQKMADLQKQIDSIDPNKATTAQEKVALLQQRQELQSQLDGMEKREDRTGSMKKARAFKALEAKVQAEETAYADALAKSLEEGTPAPTPPAETSAAEATPEDETAPAPQAEKTPEASERLSPLGDAALLLARDFLRSTPQEGDVVSRSMDQAKVFLLKILMNVGAGTEWIGVLDKEAPKNLEKLEARIGMIAKPGEEGSYKVTWKEPDPEAVARDAKLNKVFKSQFGENWTEALKEVKPDTKIAGFMDLFKDANPEMKADAETLSRAMVSAGATSESSVLDFLSQNSGQIMGALEKNAEAQSSAFTFGPGAEARFDEWDLSRVGTSVLDYNGKQVIDLNRYQAAFTVNDGRLSVDLNYKDPNGEIKTMHASGADADELSAHLEYLNLKNPQDFSPIEEVTAANARMAELEGKYPQFKASSSSPDTNPVKSTS